MGFLDTKWENPDKVPQKIVDYVKKMLTIDQTDLTTDLIKVLHYDAQIIKHIYELDIEIKKADIELKNVTNQAIKYYNFDIKRKLTSAQIQMAMKNDIDIAEVELKINILNTKLIYFESVQRGLKQKSWNMKSIVEWETYTQGNR